MAVRTRRRSTLRQAVASNEPPTPANAAAVWWADDIAQADGSQVASWTDRINNISITQATTGARPLYDVDGLNGKPAVSFDGVDDYLSYVAPNPVSISSQGCVVMVCNLTSQATVIWASSDTGSTTRRIAGSISLNRNIQTLQRNNDTPERSLLSTGIISANDLSVLEWSSDNTNYAKRLNNNRQILILDTGTNNGNWFSDTDSRDNFTIGALTRTSTDFFTAGSIAYLGVFDSPLSAQDRYNLYKWIEQYYGITGMPGLSSYEQTVLLDNPNAFWPCQDLSGGLIDIASGLGASEIGAGSAITYRSAGPRAGSYSITLPGSNKGFLVADNDIWSSLSFTMEAWVFMDPTSGTGQRFWAVKGNTSPNSYSEWAGLMYGNPSKVYNQISNSVLMAWKVNNYTPASILGGWHHVVFTHSTADNYMRTYFDGTLVQSYGPSGSGSRMGNLSGPLYLGYWLYDTAECWKGSLSYMAFYNYALTAPKVLSHYEAMTV